MMRETCSPLEVYRCFGGKYCLHIQSRSVSQASNKQSKQGFTGFLDIVHHPEFLKNRIQRFGNWICFRPQVRVETLPLLGPLE
jgi:hypothetical protein